MDLSISTQPAVSSDNSHAIAAWHARGMMEEPRSATAAAPLSPSPEALEHHIRARTWDRVRDLCVKADPGGVLVRGRARTYYVKQLAIQAVREVLGPRELTPIEAEIEVM